MEKKRGRLDSLVSSATEATIKYGELKNRFYKAEKTIEDLTVQHKEMVREDDLSNSKLLRTKYDGLDDLNMEGLLAIVKEMEMEVKVVRNVWESDKGQKEFGEIINQPPENEEGKNNSSNGVNPEGIEGPLETTVITRRKSSDRRMRNNSAGKKNPKTGRVKGLCVLFFFLLHIPFLLLIQSIFQQPLYPPLWEYRG